MENSPITNGLVSLFDRYESRVRQAISQPLDGGSHYTAVEHPLKTTQVGIEICEILLDDVVK